MHLTILKLHTMKKLTLLIAMFVLFNITTSYSWSATVPSTIPTDGSCQNGFMNIHVNTNDIFDVFEIRIINSGGVQVGYFCPVVPSGIFGSGNYNAERTLGNLWPGNYIIQVWELGLGGCGDRVSFGLASATVGQSPCFTAYTTHTDATAPNTFGCASGRLRVDMNTDHNYRVDISGPSSTTTTFYGHAYEFTNLLAGNYNIIIRNMDSVDPNCCMLVLNETVGATPCNTVFTPVPTASDLGCNNGKIEFTISQPNSIDYYDVTLSGVSNGYWTAHLVTTNTYHLFENIPPGDYVVGVFEHRVGGQPCYCENLTPVTVPENSCPPVTVVSINPQDECGPSSVTLSNGEIITQLAPGHHTLTGTYTCDCDTLPYSVEVDIPFAVCNFTVTANVVYTSSCNATITGTVGNSNCGAIVMLWKNNQTSPDPISEIGLTSNGNFNFENLANGKYQVQIKSWYSDFYCNTSTSTLIVSGIQCLPPTNETSIPQTETKVKLKWDTVDCAVGYIIKYKPVGSSQYKTKELYTNTNKTNINNLLSNTDYEWSIRTKCATGKKSDFSSTYNFCVGNNCLGARLTTATENLANELTLYPNPAKDVLQISLPDFETDNVQLQITNNMGQLVLSKSLTGNILGEQSINLADFANGIYQLNVIVSDNNYTARFIVAK